MEIEVIIRFATLAMAGVLGWLFMVLSRNITNYLSLRFTAQEISIAKETALMVVSALKQSPAYEYLAPEKKKEIAIVWMSQTLNKYGLVLSPEEIDRLIEEAVLIIKETQ